MVSQFILAGMSSNRETTLVLVMLLLCNFHKSMLLNLSGREEKKGFQSRSVCQEKFWNILTDTLIMLCNLLPLIGAEKKNSQNTSCDSETVYLNQLNRNIFVSTDFY